MSSKEGRCRTMSAKCPSLSGTCSSTSRAPRLVRTALHMSVDRVMTSTSRPRALSVLLSITGLPLPRFPGTASWLHVEHDLPAGTSTGARQHGQRLCVPIDREAVSDKARRLEAAAIEEPDDERPGCSGVAEASAD